MTNPLDYQVIPVAHLGEVAIKDFLPKLKSREISFVYNTYSSCEMVLKFCTKHGSVIVHNFKTIWHLGNDLWAGETSRNLSLRWISVGCSIFREPLGPKHWSIRRKNQLKGFKRPPLLDINYRTWNGIPTLFKHKNSSAWRSNVCDYLACGPRTQNVVCGWKKAQPRVKCPWIGIAL